MTSKLSLPMSSIRGLAFLLLGITSHLAAEDLLSPTDTLFGGQVTGDTFRVGFSGGAAGAIPAAGRRFLRVDLFLDDTLVYIQSNIVLILIFPLRYKTSICFASTSFD